MNLPSAEKINSAHQKLRSLRHKGRLAIVEHLYLVGTSNVTDLMIRFRIRQDIMSQQLRILRKAGIVNTERFGKEIYYSVNEQEIARVSKAIKTFLRGRQDL